MQKEQETYLNMTSDDEHARRLASLIVSFSNAQEPLSSQSIHNGHYAEQNDDTFRRSFQRDRKHLALCGFSIVSVGELDGQKLWSVDNARTFADTTALSDDEALLIDIACAPLVGDQSFPYRDELRLALAKIDHSFLTTTVVQVQEGSGTDACLSTLVRALNTQTCVKATYCDAHGTASERILAPYGSFGLRKSTYFVAARADAPDQAPHVYRLDRFKKVSPTARSYQIPLDFAVEDYVRLPFQMGDALFVGTFELPKDATGSWIAKGEILPGSTWRTSVSDAKLAAAWAIGEGARPLAPQDLVHAYDALLEEAAKHGC